MPARTDGELTTFGCHARDLIAAVSDVMQAPATYLLAFGENGPTPTPTPPSPAVFEFRSS